LNLTILSKKKIMSENNRINLILDIDHTLVHTIRNNQLHPSCSLEKIEDVYEVCIDGDGVYYVKFRPGIVNFLHQIRGLFDIHVYTMGTRSYAKAITETIVHKLMGGVSVFNGKILTRCDTKKNVKYLSLILPGLEQRTLILDDTPNIWKDFKHHVIPIYPYKFFQDVQGKNRGKENKDQICLKVVSTISDTHLRSMYQVLEEVNSYHVQSGNISESLMWRRRKVLQGVNILFTGVFPLGTNPSDQHLWKLAEYFGAQCYQQFSNCITHLIAARGTDKVVHAQRHGNVHIVTVNWLHASASHWTKLDEKLFQLP